MSNGMLGSGSHLQDWTCAPKSLSVVFYDSFDSMDFSGREYWWWPPFCRGSAQPGSPERISYRVGPRSSLGPPSSCGQAQSSVLASPVGAVLACAQPCPPLCSAVDWGPLQILCPRDSPEQEHWVGCRLLLQGPLTQGSHPCLLSPAAQQAGSSPLSPLGSRVVAAKRILLQWEQLTWDQPSPHILSRQIKYHQLSGR